MGPSRGIADCARRSLVESPEDAGSIPATSTRVDRRPVLLMAEPAAFHFEAAMSPTSAVEIPEYGEDAPVVMFGGEEVELGEDVGDVLLDRALADHERGGDG